MLDSSQWDNDVDIIWIASGIAVNLIKKQRPFIVGKIYQQI